MTACKTFVAKVADIVPDAAPELRSAGLTRRSLIGAHSGSTHMALDHLTLEPDGFVAPQVRAYETGVFVLSGKPALRLSDGERQLVAGDYARIPVDEPHTWIGTEESAEWLEVCTPQPRRFGRVPADVVMLEDLPAGTATGQNWPGGHFDPEDLPEPTELFDGAVVGISLHMLMDADHHDAVHHAMFIVQFATGGFCSVHDHLFEEAYFMLEGEVDCELQDEHVVLQPGMFAWAGTGVLHGFVPRTDSVRWLEVQTPQPPRTDGFRPLSAWHSQQHGAS
jgi:quercetin dioxygenase-like cupin family protein